LIREFQPPKGTKTIVLFDAWYLNPTVLKAVRERRFHWISRAKDNRVFWEGQEKSNLSTLAAKLNRSNSRSSHGMPRNLTGSLSFWPRTLRG